MRSQNLGLLFVLSLAAGSMGLAGCAAPAADDGAEDQTQHVTGGTSAVESPVVFLFASAGKDAAPACAGAMLSDKFAVTAKACAKEGLAVGRAYDKDGHGARAKVAKVHLPDGADSDIAVVELDKDLKGTNAVITHMPLRGGYAVNAFAATDGKGLFSPDKNEASTVAATIIDESETHGSLVPAKGTEICDGDIGAPVCSSTGGKVAGFNLYGTCGLSGLVVSRATPAAAPAGAGAGAGAAGAPADPTPKCSAGAWKVAQLGQHKAFLSKFAPKAFQPIVIDKPIIRNFPFAPDGLWGYKTKGDVKTCKIETTSITDINLGAASSKMTAKVAFAGMEKNATPYGRFGFALKSAPTKMRWMPAKALSPANGAAFESQFEGIVAPSTAGEYIVAFRASANGGETWTSCDTDGIENGFSAEKALVLKVTDPSAPVTPTTTPPKGNEPPTSTTPQSTEPPYTDPGTSGESGEIGNGTGETTPEDEAAPKSKSSEENGGCSVSTTSSKSGTSSLAMAGILLGLAAVVRRRRAS